MFISIFYYSSTVSKTIFAVSDASFSFFALSSNISLCNFTDSASATSLESKSTVSFTPIKFPSSSIL